MAKDTDALVDPADELLLMIPGPTPVPGRVLRAQARPMVNHRSPVFRALLRRCTERLQPAFGTASEPLILTASGTGGLEAAAVNALSPGDRVLAVITGAFGKRFADVAEAYGAQVDRLESDWGQAADPDAVDDCLRGGGYQAVLVTLNETSTGVLNPVQALAEVAHAHDALILVDAISGLLAAPCPTDAWDLDCVVAGSQKAFMIPPGLTFVSCSERYWQANASATMPRFYFDLAVARQFLTRDENPWTPAVSLLYALDEALAMLAEEGYEQVIARHRRLRDATRAGCQALGCQPLADDARASPAVTALRPPEGIAGDDLRRVLRDGYGVELAGGQGPLKGKIFRFGHLGFVTERQVLRALALLGQALGDMGAPVNVAEALSAARGAMRDTTEEATPA